jgi:hypothetical protein
MAEQWNLKIKADNIGPLTLLNFNDTFDYKAEKNKMAFFAKNGSGKTMLSKLFSLTNLSNKEKAEYRIEKLITKGKDYATFEFKCSYSIDSLKALNIRLNRNGLITINNNTDLKFHVFNDEYVKNNIVANKYKPDDKINGYIVGKINIDLTIDENNLKLLQEDLEKSNNKIQEVFIFARKELDNLKIAKNTKEYIEFTKDSILTITNYKGDTFQALIEKHNKLKSMPDNINDIGLLGFVKEEKIINIIELLNKSYSISNIAEDFRQTVFSNFDFICTGVHKYKANEKRCPFCGQDIGEAAKDLIGRYIDFFEDNEAKVLKEIEEYIKRVDNLMQQIDSLIKDSKDVLIKFNTIKEYLPSFEKSEFPNINSDIIAKKSLTVLKNTLLEKKENVSKVFDLSIEQAEISALQDDIEKSVESINKEIAKINKAKNDVGNEKLALNRLLCLSKQYETSKLIEKEVLNNKDINEKIKVQTINIEDQKAKVKKEKKKRKKRL